MDKNIVLMSLFILCSCVSVQSAIDEHKKLSHIIAEIRDVKKKVKHHQHQQSSVQHSLKKTTAAIHTLNTTLQKTTKKMQLKQQNLQVLNQKQTNFKLQINEQRALLAKQLNTYYLINQRKDLLKTLLNAEDNCKQDRLLMYCKLLSAQRVQTVRQLNTNLTSISQNKKTIEVETQKLDALTRQQKKTQQSLLLEQEKKARLLASIESQLQHSTQKLTLLTTNKKHLEKKISELAKIKVTKNYLTHHKGKFPWPVQGRIIEFFGQPIAKSQLKQNGILITPDSSSEVTAVAPGKVIFANTMPGYGLLLIVAHGNGYMTLYGNNTALYKKENDTVKSGEPIGRLDSSSKHKILYFGLRKNGKAINPCQWCGRI